MTDAKLMKTVRKKLNAMEELFTVSKLKKSNSCTRLQRNILMGQNHLREKT